MGPICHPDWVWTAADGATEKQSNHSAHTKIPGILLHRKVRSRVFVFHPKRAISTIKIPPKTSFECLRFKKLLKSIKFCSDHRYIAYDETTTHNVIF